MATSLCLASLQRNDEVAVLPAYATSQEITLEIAAVDFVNDSFVTLIDGRTFKTGDGVSVRPRDLTHIEPASIDHRKALRREHDS